MARRTRAAFLVLFSVLSIPVFAEKPWIEVRSEHFRVLTNSDATDARKITQDFEKMRYVFATRLPNARLNSGAPLTIWVPKDEKSARDLMPANAKKIVDDFSGEAQQGWERRYIYVRLEAFGPDASVNIAYHEYTHMMLRRNLRWIPRWLNEGLAEFYGGTRFEKDKIYLGGHTMAQAAVLRSREPDKIEDILAGRYSAKPYSGPFFMAQSWGFVHFLIFGPGMDQGKKLDDFIELLQQGIEQTKAFQQAFGEFKKVNDSFRNYIHWNASEIAVGQGFQTSVIRDAPKIDIESLAVRTLSPAEREAELGTYHVWKGDTDGASPLIEAALKDDPRLGFAHEAMGFLLFCRGKDSEALSEFKQANELNPKLHLSLFYQTMLLGLPASEEVKSSLGKVLELNPDFAAAYAQLAKMALQKNNLSTALDLIDKAREIEPSRAGYFLLSAEILRRMGRNAEAAERAKFVADRWWTTDRGEAIDLWNRVPAKDRSGLELASDGENREDLENTQSAEGSIQSVDCDGQKANSVTLEQPGGLLTLQLKRSILGFTDTFFYGFEHFSVCHHVQGKHAVVHYRPSKDASKPADLVELDVRDDWFNAAPDQQPNPPESSSGN